MINSSSRYLSVVLSCNAKVNETTYKEITRDLLCEYLDLCDIPFFAFIKHNADIEDSYVHYHILLGLDNARSSMSVVNDMARYFKISKSAIQCRVVRDLKEISLYLTHDSKSSIDKEHYELSQVITNDFDTYIRYREGVDIINLSMEDLIQLIDSSTSLVSLYLALGIKGTQRYRLLIRDLWNIRKGDKTCLK